MPACSTAARPPTVFRISRWALDSARHGLEVLKAIDRDSHARAISLSRELQASNPGNIELRVAVALALIGRADSHVRFKAPADAERDYSEAIGIFSALQQAGAIAGTDVETLKNAKTELAKLQRR